MSASVRTDVVDVYVVRHADTGELEFLQLRRVEEPLRGTWQPIMGHTHAAERSLDTALRELHEEVGLDRNDALAMWALEQVHPYYIARLDTIMLTPRFAVLAQAHWSPRLNQEHDAFRWVNQSDINTAFIWPGQRTCCDEIIALVRNPDSPAALVQRV